MKLTIHNKKRCIRKQCIGKLVAPRKRLNFLMQVKARRHELTKCLPGTSLYVEARPGLTFPGPVRPCLLTLLNQRCLPLCLKRRRSIYAVLANTPAEAFPREAASPESHNVVHAAPATPPRHRALDYQCTIQFPTQSASSWKSNPNIAAGAKTPSH